MSIPLLEKQKEKGSMERERGRQSGERRSVAFQTGYKKIGEREREKEKDIPDPRKKKFKKKRFLVVLLLRLRRPLKIPSFSLDVGWEVF